MIVGFGAPTYSWKRLLPTGNVKWFVGWKDIGVSVAWEEFPGGTTLLRTAAIKLNEAIWKGRETAFSQVFDVHRDWDGQLYSELYGVG